jgi:hypothetical protein
MPRNFNWINLKRSISPTKMATPKSANSRRPTVAAVLKRLIQTPIVKILQLSQLTTMSKTSPKL